MFHVPDSNLHNPQLSYSLFHRGNKLNNLCSLMARGFNVPEFIFISKNYSLNEILNAIKDKVFTDFITNTRFYQYENRVSVRSSGVASMPGLLKSVINVRPSDIQDAIKEVYNSWNSKEAKAHPDYKDAGSIIIQHMMHSNAKSGIAFTAKNGSYKFAPSASIISDNSSTKLVNGTLLGTSLEDFYSHNRNLYFGLIGALEEIHSAYGPSDVEFSFYENKLFFLQRRDFKISLNVEKEEDYYNHAMYNGCYNIGAKVWKTGKLVVETTPSPEKVINLNKDEILVTKNGSEHCHAAVLGNSLNIPILRIDSDLKFTKFYLTHLKNNLKNRIVTVSPSGIIYPAIHPLPKNTNTKVTNYYVKPNKWTPIPVKLFTPMVNLGNLLHTYYSNIHDPNYSAIDVTNLLTTYAYYACFNESLYSHADYSVGNRNEFEKNYKDFQCPEKVKTTLTTIVKIFNEESFPSSYGGEKWEWLAKNLLLFIEGKLSTREISEIIINTQHNSGSLFNKFTFINFSKYKELTGVLSQKSNANYHKFVQELSALCSSTHLSGIVMYSNLTLLDGSCAFTFINNKSKFTKRSSNKKKSKTASK